MQGYTVSSINPILISVYPCKRRWPDLPHFASNLSNSHSPSHSIQGTSCFSKTILLLSFSACVFHVFFGRPHFLLPSLQTPMLFSKHANPSSLLNTCLYHLTPFAFAIWTTVSVSLNISIRSSVLFFSISFAQHIALTIALLALLKISKRVLKRKPWDLESLKEEAHTVCTNLTHLHLPVAWRSQLCHLSYTQSHVYGPTRIQLAILQFIRRKHSDTHATGCQFVLFNTACIQVSIICGTV